MRDDRPWLGLALALALVPACATRRFDVSAIGMVPKQAGSSNGHAATLRLAGLEVTIEPLDARGTDAPAPDASLAAAPPLRLRLRLEAREVGYSFDPSRVVLRDGLQESRARLTAGPECAVTGVAGDAGAGRVWLAPRGCLLLAFDTSVADAAGQELVLDGLARGRRAIPPVTMRVARREVVARSLRPGARKVAGQMLMVPLYILLLPIAAAGAVP